MNGQQQDTAATIGRMARESNRAWRLAREEDEKYQGLIPTPWARRRTAVRRTIDLLAAAAGEESIRHAVVTSHSSPSEWHTFLVVTETLVLQTEGGQPAQLNPKVTITARTSLRQLELSENFRDMEGGPLQESGLLGLIARYKGGFTLSLQSDEASALEIEPIFNELKRDLTR